MSDWVVAALVVSLLGAAPVRAQDSVAMLHRMEARLDSLRALAEGADRAVLAATVTDTVTVGAMRVATAARFRPAVQAAVAEAWRGVSDQVGTIAAELEPLPVIVFGGIGSPLPKSMDVQELARGFEQMTVQAFWRERAADLVIWSSGGSATDTMSREDLARIVREMASAPSALNLSCLRGDTRACAAGLALDLGPDSLAAWYEPSVWPGLARNYNSWMRPEDAALKRRCVDADDLEACRAFLELSRLTSPVSQLGRRYLVNLALRAGGPGALGRLFTSDGLPIPARLEAASGLPVDSLLGQWAGNLREAAPSSPAPSLAESVIVLGWCAALLGMVVGRGRWR